MKKVVLTFLITFLIIGCMYSQSLVWVLDEEKQYVIPKGECNWDELVDGAFFPEMKEYFTLYSPNEDIINEIAKQLRSELYEPFHFELVIYFGAWCGDSREHLPKMMKILDALRDKYHIDISFRLIGCDREKHYMDNIDEEKEVVEFVPTFHCYFIDPKSGPVLIGSIVEAPNTTIEEDMLKLITEARTTIFVNTNK